MNEYTCKFCESKFKRRGKKKAVFCSINCKAEWQKTQKPVTKEWLYQKYVVEGLGTTEIGKIVKRHPKRVYEWLVDLEIPIRTREWGIETDVENKPYQSKEWLVNQYIVHEKSVPDIAIEQEVSTGAIMHFMRKFSIDRRSVDEARKIKYWGLSGEDNPMYGVRGEANHNWKGGTTPERQALYSSKKWTMAVSAVWKRDNATCQRCELKKNENRGDLFHIHHIASFSDYPDLRAEVSNLVLLCAPCHYFVHSKENTNKEFIK